MIRSIIYECTSRCTLIVCFINKTIKSTSRWHREVIEGRVDQGGILVDSSLTSLFGSQGSQRHEPSQEVHNIIASCTLCDF